MSWYNRRPRTKEPQRYLHHYRYSPSADKFMEEAKETGRPIEYKKSTIEDKLQPKTPGT